MNRVRPDAPVADIPDSHRPVALRIALALCAVLAFALFAALGTWQVERRAWKLALMERTDQRVHAPAVDAPGADRWPQVNAADDEYRHVRAAGTFLHDKETLVQATTDLGSGFWVLTPLRMADGKLLMINRGFVPERNTRRSAEPLGETTVTGLLRITEPVGGLLRRNDPAAGRWYSRDVQAIAAARGLDAVAPYFVDADAAASPVTSAGASAKERSWPAGGLTVIAFHNNHLVYAITWYALALMIAGAAWYAVREGRRPAPRPVDNGGQNGTRD